MVQEKRKCLLAEGGDEGLVGVSCSNPLSSEAGTSRPYPGLGFEGKALFKAVSSCSLFARQSRPNSGLGFKGKAR